MEFCIENEYLKVCSKTEGAELTSVVFKETGKEYLWQAGELWKRHAPVMFPVVGRCNGGEIKVDGRAYPMPMHGFARDMEFEPIQQDVSSVTYCLTSDENTEEKYPYRFKFYVTYTVIGHSVDVNFEIENTGDEELCYCLGSHPAFNCNVEEGSLEDFFLEFAESEDCGIYRKNELHLSHPAEKMDGTNVLKLSGALFEGDALIFKDLKSESVRLKNKEGNTAVKVTFREFPYLVVWSKGDCFVCIEPCMGIDDAEDFVGALNEKACAETVAPGDLSEHGYQIKIY